jgi:hypothetical protein
VAFVDHQNPVEQLAAQGFAIMRSQIAFARGAPGPLIRSRMPSAAKTASKALLTLKPLVDKALERTDSLVEKTREKAEEFRVGRSPNGSPYCFLGG